MMAKVLGSFTPQGWLLLGVSQMSTLPFEVSFFMHWSVLIRIKKNEKEKKENKSCFYTCHEGI